MDKITYAFPKRKGVDPSCYIDAYNLVLECSQAHTLRGFSIRLLELLKKVCPYDSAMVFFFNANGKISGKYAVGAKEDWLDMFLDYYLNMVPEFDIYRGAPETSDCQFSRIIDWSTFPPSEFKRDYIDVLGLKYSWGFCFFDLNGAYRVVISLDRIRDIPFSDAERTRFELALPILNNMHKNFFYQGIDTRERVVQTPWVRYGLTTRESEIVALLCQGMTAQNISNALFIAITTTYKHISNIFRKVGVSSQQELIVKLIGRGL